MPTLPPQHGRLARFFFMHLGTLVAIIVYFTIFERGAHSVDALKRALLVALVVHTGYALLARWQDEFKQFDLGLWIFLAIGAVAVTMGIGPVVELYQRYSPALLFAMFGLTTVIPLLAGREPFTVWYGVRQFPRW